MKKTIALAIGFILSIPIAFAQTGLFNDATATTFAITGITIVVVIVVIAEIFKKLFKKK